MLRDKEEEKNEAETSQESNELTWFDCNFAISRSREKKDRNIACGGVLLATPPFSPVLHMHAYHSALLFILTSHPNEWNWSTIEKFRQGYLWESCRLSTRFLNLFMRFYLGWLYLVLTFFCSWCNLHIVWKSVRAPGV